MCWKNLLILTITILFFSNAQAQYPQGGQFQGGGQLKGHVFGKVIDETNQAIDFATIVLMKPEKDSATQQVKYKALQTATTEANGDFAFFDIPFQPNLKVRFTSFGYQTLDTILPFYPKNISMGVMEVDLGKVQLKPEKTTTLDAVKIVAVKPLIKLEADKRVFDVSKDHTTDGGTAVDVLKNVPGVNVDIDGNVQVRSEAPQIYIDGRPTTLTLDQIPAESIESVEVMTNPSAKFDASGGGAGIINIILKKNKKTGYNGTLSAGLDSYLGYNFRGNFNYRQNKFNFSTSLNYMNRRGTTTSEVNRKNFRSLDTLDNIMSQEDISKRKGYGFFGRIGVDYLPTNKTSFSVGASLWRGVFGGNANSDINTDSVYANNPNTYYYQRLNNSMRKMLNYGVSLGFKQLFKRKDEALTFDASFDKGNFDSNTDYTSNYHVTDINSPFSYAEYQRIIGDGDYYNTVFQTDYSVPLHPFKIETGLRAQLRGRMNDNENYRKFGGNYVNIPNPASNYTNTDNVYAAYITLSKQYNKFGYQAGLRAESSDFRGTLTNTGEKFKVQYPISLFPSAFLSYKLNDKQDLQLNYSRRVNRPNFFQIVPFVDSSDVFNMQRGNSNLQPEFTHNMELQYLNNFNQKNTLLVSAYYKYTTHLITRFIEHESNGDLINTYVNANSAYSTGFEIISTNAIKNFLEITTSINIYNSRINSTAFDSYATKARWAGFGKLNLLFKLPLDFSIQLSTMYQTKSNLPINESERHWGPSPAQSSSQGYLDDYWGMDIAIRKTFFNRHLIVNLSVSDIFGSKHYINVSQSEFFYQNYDRIQNPYMVRLNVTWSFGKMDATLFKRLSKGTGESVME